MATFDPLLVPKFIQARNYRRADRTTIRLIVVHTMEAPEKPHTAEGVAKWFAGASAPMASAHVCIDNREIVECVRPTDVAFGAPKANRDGYHIEHAGFATQDNLAWNDEYSKDVLTLSARWAARIAKQWGIPIVKVNPQEILAGNSGFCGHGDVSEAYKTKGGHVDPGKWFPWGNYLESVIEEYGP